MVYCVLAGDRTFSAAEGFLSMGIYIWEYEYIYKIEKPVNCSIFLMLLALMSSEKFWKMKHLFRHSGKREMVWFTVLEDALGLLVSKAVAKFVTVQVLLKDITHERGELFLGLHCNKGWNFFHQPGLVGSSVKAGPPQLSEPGDMGRAEEASHQDE